MKLHNINKQSLTNNTSSVRATREFSTFNLGAIHSSARVQTSTTAFDFLIGINAFIVYAIETCNWTSSQGSWALCLFSLNLSSSSSSRRNLFTCSFIVDSSQWARHALRIIGRWYLVIGSTINTISITISRIGGISMALASSRYHSPERAYFITGGFIDNSCASG